VYHFSIYYLSCPFIFTLGFLSKFQAVHLVSLYNTGFYKKTLAPHILWFHICRHQAEIVNPLCLFYLVKDKKSMANELFGEHYFQIKGEEKVLSVTTELNCIEILN